MTAADLYISLWRHRLFIVVMTAVLALATWYLTSQQTPVYQASTLVRVQQSAQDTSDPIRSLDLGERLARTYARIVTTRELSERIARELDNEVPVASIHGHVSADPVQDLELLTISARSPDPRLAQRIANAAPPALQDFIRQKGTLREQIVTVERAAVPTSPAAPSQRFNLAVAIVLGLLFNGALALLLELLSDRLPKPEELERTTGLPVLAIIPALTFARASLTDRAPGWNGESQAEVNDNGGGAARSVRATEGAHD